MRQDRFRSYSVSWQVATHVIRLQGRAKKKHFSRKIIKINFSTHSEISATIPKIVCNSKLTQAVAFLICSLNSLVTGYIRYEMFSYHHTQYHPITYDYNYLGKVCVRGDANTTKKNHHHHTLICLSNGNRTQSTRYSHQGLFVCLLGVENMNEN